MFLALANANKEVFYFYFAASSWLRCQERVYDSVKQSQHNPARHQLHILSFFLVISFTFFHTLLLEIIKLPLSHSHMAE